MLDFCPVETRKCICVVLTANLWFFAMAEIQLSNIGYDFKRFYYLLN
jgi:hypothetical protein